MKFIIEANLFLYAVIFVGVVSMGSLNAQQQDAPIEDKIEQCRSLEDDDPEQAIALAKTSIATLNKFNSPVDYGLFLGCMGWAYAVSDQIENSRETVYLLEKIAVSLNETEHSVKLLRRVGSIYHRIGDRFSATESYGMAMQQADHLDLVEQKIPLLVNLGVLNSEIREHDKAIENYYMALDLMKSIDDYNYQAPVLFNLAVTLNGQKHFNEAIKIYHEVENLIDEHWPQQRVGQVYFGLAAGYEGINQQQIALDYIEKTISTLGTEYEPNIFSHAVQIFYARVKAKMGDKTGALNIADQAAAYFSIKENESALISADNPLNALALLYELIDEPIKALATHKASRVAGEKFQESFNKQTMAQMQARLSNRAQREELDVLKSQHNYDQIKLNKTAYQRTLMIMVIVFMLVILIIIWLWQSHSKRQLLKLSIMDSLTQLKNRRGVQYWNSHHKLPAEPYNRYLWLIDIDHFKRINDDLGHDAGDATLQQVAKLLKKQLNKFRCIGRWGGEEFILITQDLSLAEVKSEADRLLAKLREVELTHGMNKFNVTCSIGISLIKDSSDHMWNRALSQADKALYVAKDRGRDCMAMATDF